MSFYRICNLVESVTLSVKDAEQPKQVVRNIYDLGHALHSRIAQMFPAYANNKSRNNPSRAIDMDGLETHEQEGIINFYTDGIPEPLVPKITQAISYVMGDYNVTAGKPTQNASNLFKSNVVRIPVKIHKTQAKFAPEVNIANDLAMTIFHDMLNIPSQFNLNGGSISAHEILFKMGQIWDVDKHVTKPSQDKNWIDAGVSKERLTRKLAEIESLAKWAIANDYSEIQFA